MTFTFRRKVRTWLAALSLVFLLAGPVASATPVFADCSSSSSSSCSG